jgi:hypothetical protein
MARGGANAASFVGHRNFAASNAFAPSVNNNWSSRGYGSDHGGYTGYGGYYGGWNGGWSHLGWIGPLFWPYAYGDVFYSADIKPLLIKPLLSVVSAATAVRKRHRWEVLLVVD